MRLSPKKDPRRTGAIWVMDLDAPIPVLTPGLPAVFRRLGPDSTPVLTAAPGGGPAAEISRRFETGRRCYAAWVAGELAAYGWVSFVTEHVGELNLRLRLLPGEAYIWDCATLPAFRRNHLYSGLLVYIVGELRADPLCRAWIGADLDNVASQRGIARAGFHRVADLLTAGNQPRQHAWLEGLPGVPDSLVAEARRVFLDNRDQVRSEVFSGPP